MGGWAEMRDFAPDLVALRQRLDQASGYLRIEELRTRRTELEEEMADPDLWNDQDRGRRVQVDLSRVIEDLDHHAGLVARLEDVETLAELAVEEGEESLESEITEVVAALDVELEALEVRSLFSGEYDNGEQGSWVLVTGDAIKEGDAVLSHQLPGAVDGLKVASAPTGN